MGSFAIAPEQLQYLTREFLPEFFRGSEKRLRIWCCQCGWGEGAYAFAMLAQSLLPNGYDFRVLATDTDTQALANAMNGVYPAAQLEAIPRRLIEDYTVKGGGDVADWFRIRSSIRDKISFRPHDLTENTYPGDELFDVIVADDALKRFDPEARAHVLYKLSRSLKTSGSLLTGTAAGDGLEGGAESWQPLAPSIYKKVLKAVS